MSIYSGELTKMCIAKSTLKINQAFPSLPPEFFDIFADRIKENNFNDERLKAAVDHVIDNCVYPTPSIAQFISFDKNIKVYTYIDMINFVDEIGSKAFELYRPVRIGNNKKPVWVSVNDIEQYNLTEWSNG